MKTFKIFSLRDYLVVFKDISKISPKLILLSGDLGAGKTTFVKEFLFFTYSEKEVLTQDFMSPTFSIINEYEFKEDICAHIDLYRLNPPEIKELGLEEVLESSKYTFVEWYKNDEKFVESLSQNKIYIDIRKISEEERELTLSCN